MNSRIMEYAKDAGFDVSEDSSKVKLLSKSIIDECIEICQRESAWWKSQNKLVEAGEAFIIASLIKDHFEQATENAQ